MSLITIFFRFAFHREWNDLSQLDLVISKEKMSELSVTDVIVETAQNQEVKTCSLTALDAIDLEFRKAFPSDAFLRRQASAVV